LELYSSEKTLTESSTLDWPWTKAAITTANFSLSTKRQKISKTWCKCLFWKYFPTKKCN